MLREPATPSHPRHSRLQKPAGIIPTITLHPWGGGTGSVAIVFLRLLLWRIAGACAVGRILPEWSASSAGEPGRRFPEFTDCGLFQAIVRGGAVQTTTCGHHEHPSTPPLLPVRARARPARLAGEVAQARCLCHSSRPDSLRSADAPPSPQEPPPPVTAPDTRCSCCGDGSARQPTPQRQSNTHTNPLP